MVLNYIWIAFFLIAFVIALIKVIFLGDMEIFTAIMNSTFDSSKTALGIESRTAVRVKMLIAFSVQADFNQSSKEESYVYSN